MATILEFRSDAEKVPVKLVRRKRRLVWLAWSSAVIIGCILMTGSMYYRFSGM